MTTPPTERPNQANRRDWIIFAATTVFLTAVGFVVSAFLMFPLGMASDGCAGGGGTDPICDPGVQNLVIALPWIALVCAVVSSTVTAVIADRRFGHSPFVGIGVGAVAYFVPIAVAWCLGLTT